MKVIVMSKTTPNIIYYEGVTAISKAGTIISITHSGGTATADTAAYIVRIIES